MKVLRTLLLPLLDQVDLGCEQVEGAALALHPPHLTLPLAHLVDAKVPGVPPGNLSELGWEGFPPDGNNAPLNVSFSNCSLLVPLNDQTFKEKKFMGSNHISKVINILVDVQNEEFRFIQRVFAPKKF